jgi:acetoin utilization deacetylase AcuC-like enzyme
MSTAYFTHPLCHRHEMGAGHPECPQRLAAIEDRLLVTGLADLIERRLAPEAQLAELERAHGAMLIASIADWSDQAGRSADAGGSGWVQIDPDTAANRHTWAAALRAAGAVIAATDAVIAGEADNAFCAVRPPGHHACRSQAMGFCFFNNVAVAALHALEVHGLKRVAIVDFDVHHGNGTEDIVAGDERILMVSFFQHPLYPYSGTDPAASNLLNLPVPPYTRGPAIRDLVEQHWLPRLEAFAPELIFISAGFDAHRDDELGQLGLVEADYAWITRRLMDLAARHARGRIVSSLEGGYHLDALARSVEAHLRTLADL